MKSLKSTARRSGLPNRVCAHEDVHLLPFAMRRALAQPYDVGPIATIPTPPEQIMPEERPAGRTVSLRGNKGSAKSAISLSLPEANVFIRERAESLLEKSCIQGLASRPDFLDLQTQVGPVTYRSASGALAEHFIDIVFTDLAGCRTAFLVKPWHRASSQRFRGIANAVARAAVPNYADEVRILTEADFARSDATNASMFLQFSRFPDPEADQALSEAACSFEGVFTIDRLIRGTGLGGRAFRSAVKAIFRGELTLKSFGTIDRWTLVAREEVA